MIKEEFKDEYKLKTGEMPILLFFELEKKFAQKLINIIDISLSSLESSLKNDIVVDDSVAVTANTLKSQEVRCLVDVYTIIISYDFCSLFCDYKN